MIKLSQPQNKGSSSRWRRLAYVLVGCVGIFLCLLALLPMFASTQWAKNRVLLPYANARIDGTLTVENLSLSWCGEQKVTGLDLKDNQGQTLLHVDSLVTDTCLWKLLFGQSKLGKIQISDLNAILEQESNGVTNFDRVLFQDKTPKDSTRPTERIAVKQADAQFQLPSSNSPLILKLMGKTEHHGNIGAFEIDATMEGLEVPSLWKRSGFSFVPSNLKLHANVIRFPIAVLDHIIAIRYPAAQGLTQGILGDELNMTFKQASNEKGNAISLTLETPHLTGYLEGSIKDEAFHLTNPGVFKLQLQPQFFLPALEKLLNENQIVLKKNGVLPSLLEVRLQELDIPFALQADFPLNVRANLAIDRLDIGHPFSFQHILATVQTSQDHRQLLTSVDSATMHKGRSGALKLDAQFALNIDRKNQPKADLLQLTQAEISGKGLPIELGEVPSLLSKAVGPYFDVQTKLQWHEKGLEAVVQFSSEHVSIPSLHVAVNDRLALMEPAAFTYRLPPSIWLHLAEDDNQAIPIHEAVLFSGTLKTFSIPFPVKGDLFKLPVDDMALQADIRAEKLRIKDWTIQQMQVHIDAPSLQRTHVSLTSAIYPPALSPSLQPLFAKGLTLNVDSQIYMLDLQNLQVGELTATLQGAWKAALKVEPFDVALNNFKLSRFKLDGNLTIDQLFIPASDGSPLARVYEASMPWFIDGPANKATIALSAKTHGKNPQAVGTITAHALIKDWITGEEIDLQRAFVKAEMDLDRFPVAFAETVADRNDLEVLLGTTLNLKVDTQFAFQNSSAGVFNVRLEGSDLLAEAALKIQDAITLSDPAQPMVVKWTLTPERFKHVRKLINPLSEKSKLALSLKEAAEFNAKITDLRIPLRSIPASSKESGAQGFDFLHAAAHIQLEADKMTVVESAKYAVVLHPISFNLTTNDLSGSVLVGVNAKGYTQGKTSEPSEMKLTAILQNGWTPQGSFNHEGATITVDGKAKQAPMLLLAGMIGLEDSMLNQMNALIGHQLDADVHARIQNMHGPLQAELKGAHGSLSLDGQLQNGILTLQKPFKAETTVSPTLSESVLQDIVPFLSSAVNADKPITITIEPKGFALPLKPWDINNVMIGKATIDLGKIYFTADGEIGQLLRILNYKPRQADPLMVWFTPLYVSMRGGSVNIERMDMLAVQKYPIAVWGLVDFLNDKVKMVVGISGPALKNAFSITGLPGDYLLQLPLKGTTEEASVDKIKATAKISALVAQSQGPQGALIGGLLDLVGGAFKEKTPPPPTTKPLPWVTSGDFPDSDTQGPEASAEKKENSSLIPLKTLEKGASQLLKMLR